MNQPSGQCPSCKQANPYTALICEFCGKRLPWASAVQPPADVEAAMDASLLKHEVREIARHNEEARALRKFVAYLVLVPIAGGIGLMLLGYLLRPY